MQILAALATDLGEKVLLISQLRADVARLQAENKSLDEALNAGEIDKPAELKVFKGAGEDG